MMLIMFSSELPWDQLAGYDATFQLEEREVSRQVSPSPVSCLASLKFITGNPGHMSG